MSNFERIYHTDPSRENKVKFEKSDEDYYKIPYRTVCREKTWEQEVFESLEEASKDNQEIKVEKSKTKSSKRKFKKNNSKLHKPAMESLQKKLS